MSDAFCGHERIEVPSFVTRLRDSHQWRDLLLCGRTSGNGSTSGADLLRTVGTAASSARVTRRSALVATRSLAMAVGIEGHEQFLGIWLRPTRARALGHS